MKETQRDALPMTNAVHDGQAGSAATVSLGLSATEERWTQFALFGLLLFTTLVNTLSGFPERAVPQLGLVAVQALATSLYFIRVKPPQAALILSLLSAAGFVVVAILSNDATASPRPLIAVILFMTMGSVLWGARQPKLFIATIVLLVMFIFVANALQWVRPVRAEQDAPGVSLALSLLIALSTLIPVIMAGYKLLAVQRQLLATTQALSDSNRDLREQTQIAKQQTRLAEIKSGLAEQASAALAEANDAQKRMFAVIAHELRTPAAIINMLIHAEQNSIEALEHGQELVTTSEHLLNVIDDLRAVTSPEDQLPVNPAPFSMAALIRDVVNQTHNTFKQAGMRLSLDMRDLDQIQHISDAYRLRSVIVNLLRNAALHSEGKKVYLSGRHDPVGLDRDLWVITIEDDGKGIDEQYIEQMFEPFQRGDTRSGGTGLGLHIVATWVELLDGTVTCGKSDLGGAKFTLYLELPRAQSVDDRKLHGKRIKAVKRNLTGQSVLVIDSSEDRRRANEGIFERHYGMQVITASSCEQALDVLIYHPVALIFVCCPKGGSGVVKMTQALRDANNETAVIALSELNPEDEAATAQLNEFLEAGVDSVIYCPLDPSELNAVLIDLSKADRLLLDAAA